MHREQLKAIKQFFCQFSCMNQLKLTQKSLSDGYIFMQFLSLVDYQHFDTTQLTKPLPQSNQKQYDHMLVFIKPPLQQSNKQLDLMSKMKNWKTVIRKIKQYFSDRHDKGVKYGDVDLVDLCKNSTVEEIVKLFELVLCVVANCDNKDQLIGKMMDLEESTQVILAGMMQTALQTRICSLQSQQRMELIEQLQLKEQQLSSLYLQVTRLQQLNSQYLERLEQYEKSASELQYQKQKLRRFNKKNSLIVESINGSTSFLGLQDSCQCEPGQDSQYIMEESVNYPRGTHKNIVQSLKNKLIREEQQHEMQLQQLQQQIQDLQQQLKQKSHFQQLLVIYQQKYQQALAYVEKVTQYQKEKNKIYQEIIQKDIIIQELKVTIAENNQKVVEVQEEKIDLQLLLAKKNNQRLSKKCSCNKDSNKRKDKDSKQKGNSHNNNEQTPNNTNQTQLLYKTHLRTLKKHQTVISPSFIPSHNRQSSQQVPRLHSHISLSFYPFQDDQNIPNSRADQLQIKVESQSLQIKRLQRKEKELVKHNNQLKTKLEKMRKIQNQNKKLSNIIVQLHTRKNEQTQILVSCLHQTFTQYDFKFHKLIGDNYLNTQTIIKKQSLHNIKTKSPEKPKFTQVSNLPSRPYRMSAFSNTYSSQHTPNSKKFNRNNSVSVSSRSDQQPLDLSINQQENSYQDQ